MAVFRGRIRKQRSIDRLGLLKAVGARPLLLAAGRLILVADAPRVCWEMIDSRLLCLLVQ